MKEETKFWSEFQVGESGEGVYIRIVSGSESIGRWVLKDGLIKPLLIS